MAINPNFVFQDPRIQAGVIGMAQIRAAEEAARLQRQAQSQQFLTQSQVARDNAAAERARNDSYLAQSERESARTDATKNKDLELRRTVEENYRKAFEADRGAVTADKEKAARAKAQEATLLKIAENVNDPVPPTEWATNKVRYGADLSPSQIDSLDQTWKQTREAVGLRFDEATRRASGWTTKLRDALETIKDDPNGTIRQSRINSILDEFTKSKQEDLKFDPASGGFVSIFRRLREDPPRGPGTANQEVLPATDAQPRIRSLFDVPRRVTTGGFGGFINPEIAGGLSVGEPSIQRFTSPSDEQQFPPPLPFYSMSQSAPPNMGPPLSQQPALRSWQPPPSFIPNTGSVGYYSPPPPRNFQPVPAPQQPAQDPGSFLNFLQNSVPEWAYRPIFSERGLIGPTGLAGQGVFGQQPAQIPPPQFVPPQYLSTDTMPRGMQPFIPPQAFSQQRPMLSPYNY